MSTLTGHSRITQAAVKELMVENSTNPLIQGLDIAGLPGAVVARDILDVVLLGHWLDYGQAHHFMRRFDGQSPYAAYEEGVTWVHSNARAAANQLAARIRRYFPGQDTASLAPHAMSSRSAPGAAPHAPAMTRSAKQRDGGASLAGILTFGGTYGGDPTDNDVPNWQSLGNALHALQDSFATGHVERAEPLDTFHPGEIKYIKVYHGDGKVGHDHMDEQWWDQKSGDWSTDGRLAIEGSKTLISRIVTTAVLQRGKSIGALDGWNGFQQIWLRAAEDLSRERVFEVDFIERFRTGPRFGASSLTFKMDEDGLARALYYECGTDTQQVYKVFRELDEHHNSDADDVAEIYVTLIRQNPAAIASALKADQDLRDLLVKVLKEGWTSAGEAACIEFVKGL